MMLTICKVILAIALAVAGALVGQRWILQNYRREPDVLSYPSQVMDKAARRQQFLTMSMGFLFCFTALQSNLDTLNWVSAVLLEWFCLLFIATDWEQHVIFDRMLLPCAILGLVFTCLTGSFPGDLMNHVLAGLAGGAVFLLLAILTRGGIGGGDVKLMAVLGLWFGTQSLLTIAMTGIILAGLVALVLLLTKQKGRLDYIAYGPYFALAAILTIIF